MPHVVTKPFNTTNRRFRLNDAVAETDDLAPHTFGDLKTRGFIAETKDAETPAPRASRFNRPD